MELLLVRDVSELSSLELSKYNEWSGLQAQYRKHRKILESTGRDSSSALDIAIGKLGFFCDFLLASETVLTDEHLEGLAAAIARLEVGLVSAKKAFLSLPELTESPMPVAIAGPNDQPQALEHNVMLASELQVTDQLEAPPVYEVSGTQDIKVFSSVLMAYSQEISEIFTHYGLRGIVRLTALQQAIEESRMRLSSEGIDPSLLAVLIDSSEQDSELPEYSAESQEIEDAMRYIFYHRADSIRSEELYLGIMSQELKQVVRIYCAVDSCIKQLSAKSLVNIVQHLNPDLKTELIASLRQAQTNFGHDIFSLINLFETHRELAKIARRYSLI